MSTLHWIIVMCATGGVLCVLAAAFITQLIGLARISLLISYAVGALLGAVFIEILPHAFSDGANVQRTAAVILGGLLGFFLLEKLVIWRHCHAHDLGDDCEAHAVEPVAHDHGRSGAMVLIGDTFHNFVDGILIAAAFLESTPVGIVAAVAIITHEIPQALGNYLVLLHSGFSRRNALLFNLLASLSMLLGGLIAYFALQASQQWVPVLLALAASSMIYVAVADLIPGLHRRSEIRATLQQMILILAGVATIWLVPLLLGGHGHGHGHSHDAHDTHEMHETETMHSH